MRTTTTLTVVILSMILLSPSLMRGQTLALTVDLPDRHEYQVMDSEAGQRLGFEDCGYLMAPGCPMLPTKTVLIALPPGVAADAVDVGLIGSYEFLGSYSLATAPSPVPLGPPGEGENHRHKLILDSRLTTQRIYASDDAYPTEQGRITGSGSLGEYRYVAVSICPCAYHPRSGKLVGHSSAVITLAIEPVPGAYRSMMTDHRGSHNRADERASELLINYDQVMDLYGPRGTPSDATLQTYDYVIITTSSLAGAVTSSDFITWKASLGYSVRVVLITDPEISGQPGDDLAEQIRSFLRAYYAVWGIEYVLMVGDYATVPMRYCYPDPTNHTNTAGTPGGTGGEVPTDYYYADLSDLDEASWDSDGDGYYGEYGQDTPDFMPEVYVGRIPVNNVSYITNTLNKTVTFEQDTGAWKSNALHAGAFWYFTHELSDTAPAMDGAKFLSYIESDIMSGWTIAHFSEQSGLETSAYAWPALTHDAFTGAWRTGQYSVVNWGAHGWTDRIGRKIWEWDDGDGIPEEPEFSWPDIVSTSSTLDDDYPSIVSAVSCYVGYPEPNDWGRMGIRMLTRPGWGPAVGVIASARSPYGAEYWPPGGSESIIYEFNGMMINGPEKVGEALYNSKFYCTTTYGWDHYAEYINLYTFNLYGDPSLTREGIDLAGVLPGSRDHQVPDRAHLVAWPSPARGSLTISYYVPSPARTKLEILDVLGRRVRSFEVSHRPEGWHRVVWDGRRDDGTVVASGIYWVRLVLPGETQTVRFTRLR